MPSCVVRRLSAMAVALAASGVSAHVKAAAPAALSLRDLVNEADRSSPLLRAANERLEAGDAATELARAGHFPVVRLSQSFLGSNNPVQAFSAKLQERDFSASDFEIARLNHPSFRVLNQTSALLQVPIFLGGAVSAATHVAEAQRSALGAERDWTRKEVIRNIYALYHAYWSLIDLEAFLGNEKEYLDRIVRSYDAKTPENRNRYLSYNEARIILSSIDEGLEGAALERQKVLTSLSYLTGVPVERLTSPEPDGDPLADFDWQATSNGDLDEVVQRRQDVRAAGYMREAAEHEADRARSTLIPSLLGFAQYNINTEKFSRFAEDTTVGLSLAWSIGVSSFRQIELAHSNVAVATRTLDERWEAARTELVTLRADVARLSEALAEAKKRHELFVTNKELMTVQYEQGSLELYNMLENFMHYLENYRAMQQTRIELRAALIRYADNFREVL